MWRSFKLLLNWGSFKFVEAWRVSVGLSTTVLKLSVYHGCQCKHSTRLRHHVTTIAMSVSVLSNPLLQYVTFYWIWGTWQLILEIFQYQVSNACVLRMIKNSANRFSFSNTCAWLPNMHLTWWLLCFLTKKVFKTSRCLCCSEDLACELNKFKTLMCALAWVAWAIQCKALQKLSARLHTGGHSTNS